MAAEMVKGQVIGALHGEAASRGLVPQLYRQVQFREYGPQHLETETPHPFGLPQQRAWEHCLPESALEEELLDLVDVAGEISFPARQPIFGPLRETLVGRAEALPARQVEVAGEGIAGCQVQAR
ncbi:hypothetical protein P4114_08715 [Pseudomonas aeruginosa]|nr:hypothetical protein [Pseudomonas aeruginosa]